MKEQIIEMIGRLFRDTDRHSENIKTDLEELIEEIQELIDAL